MYTPFTIASKFIRFWITASNRKGHGVHSPFVFDFIEKVLNDRQTKSCYREIECVRKKLLTNKSWIDVEDFGAGSSIIKTKQRRIDKIAASSLKPKKYAQLIHRIVAYYQPKNIIELGTSFGITTSYMAKANTLANIHTFEGSPSIANIAQNNFKDLSIDNIQLHTGDFKKTFPDFLSETQIIDFAFIDGNHRKDPTIQYFNQLLQHSNDSSILIFDDIHWSKEMEEAWKIIQSHPSVTLSIDLFFIGLVFFKKEFKEKQHFTIQF